MNKVEELNWILSRIRACDGTRTEKDGQGAVIIPPRVYMLEQVIEAKEYCVADVHAWGKEPECAAVYGKVRDILRMRMIESDVVDKAVKLRYLAAFEGFVDE